MLSPKTRGQLMVCLANSNLKDNSSQPDNPDRVQDIPAPLNDRTNADVDTDIEVPNSTCNDLFNSITPIIEVIDHSNINFTLESNSVDIIPNSCLDSIDILFPLIEEEKLKYVNIEQNNNEEIDFSVQNICTGTVTVSLPNDISINKNNHNTDTLIKEKALEGYISTCIDNQPHISIIEEQMEANADILNYVNQNRINIEDPDFIPKTNYDDSDEMTLKNNGRPKKGRKRKYKDQNSTIRKKKANTNQDYFSAK